MLASEIVKTAFCCQRRMRTMEDVSDESFGLIADGTNVTVSRTGYLLSAGLGRRSSTPDVFALLQQICGRAAKD